MKRSGRKSAAQTPAPQKERVYGSKKNPSGSAASKRSAASITLSESITETLKNKKEEFEKKYPSKSVGLATLKAVMRRGMGAYSKSHRPTISGGAPNSRQAWGFARVNKFLLKKAGKKVKAAYVQDDDLLKYGGEMEKQIALPDTYANYDTLKPILAKQGYKIEKMQDLPVGKLAKGMSLSEVAKHHGLTADDLKSELKMGIEKEMEHTDHPEYARAIAMDHLYEDPKYYTKYKQMEGLDKHLSEISSKYAEGGEINPIFSFKTPTGENSRLTYLQQVLVRTTNFKKFFGDWEAAAKSYLLDNKDNFEKHYRGVSIALDYVTLEPALLHHGTRTREEFFRFDVTKEKGVGRPYGYFAYNEEYSKNFTDSSQRGESNTKPFLYKVFVDAKKPFYAIGRDYERKNRKAEDWLYIIIGTIVWDTLKTVEKTPEAQQLETVVRSQIGDYLNQVYAQSVGPFWRLMAADTEKDFKYFLMSYGYDSIFYTEEFSREFDPENPAEFTKAVTIFDSKQVKLADGRNLNFNPMLDDIRYDEGGEVEEHSKPELHMNKKMKLGALLFGDEYAEGGEVIDKKGNASNDGKKGGYFKGRSHDEGGIKAINVDTGQLIEVEGEEVIITKGAVNDETKREFEGEMLTNREILSRINQSGGGVSFEEGGELHGSSCGCSGKKYNYGGQLLEDFQILRRLSHPYDSAQVQINKARSFVDDLVSKFK